MVTERLTHAGDGHRYYRFPVELTANRRKRARAEQSKVSFGAQRFAEHAGRGTNTPWGAPFLLMGKGPGSVQHEAGGKQSWRRRGEGGGGFVAPQPQHMAGSYPPLQTATKGVQRKKRSQHARTTPQPSPAHAWCLSGSWGMSWVLPAALGYTAQEEGGKSK